MPEHFYRPKRSTRWYVRLVAPESIRQHVPQAEYRQSTGHAELRKALPIGSALIAEKRREWASLEAALADCDRTFGVKPTILTGPLVDSICAARLYASMSVDEKDRCAPEGLDEDALRDIDDFCTMTDVTMRSVLAQGPASPRWAELVPVILNWCWTMGYELDTADPMFVKLVRAFAAVEKEAAARIRARNKGDDVPLPALPPLGGGPKLSDLTTVYREYKTPSCGESHLGALMNAWTLFIEHCGDIQLDSVTPAHVFDFLNARIGAEHKPWSGARALQFGRRVLREIFGLARSRNLMTRANPVDEMDVPPAVNEAVEAQHRNPRYPFSADQLNTLFSSAWYDPTNDKHFTGKMRTDLGARYWVPLIGLFHGNRVREALQLTAGDFWFEADVLVMSFRTEVVADSESPGDVAASASLQKLRRVKNLATRRSVPVHPALLELGFAEFVEQQRAEQGAGKLLFPSSLPKAGGKRPKLGRAYEQAFLRFVRDRLAFGHGFGNHSFRHQLEDRIRAAQRVGEQWPAGMGQQFTGRKRTRDADRMHLLAQGSEAAYGTGYPSTLVKEYVARLDFSDVELPLPFDLWVQLEP